jgi:hypothetical protein
MDTMRMCQVVVLGVFLLSAGGCAGQPDFRDPFTRPQIDWRPSIVLDREAAARILGSPGHLERETAYLDDGTKAYQSAFYDDGADPVTGKTGVVYFMHEEYETAAAARSFLDSTLKANHVTPAAGLHMEGGAELHYLAGGPVPWMVLIWKGTHLLRLKVNPVTSRYSLDERREVARELAEQL